MQEFSSVTASSYDADSLAPLLNEKAADGWSVVSIVAAGTNIVAYLQREADDHATTPDETADTTLDTVDDVAASVPTYGDTPGDDAPADEAPVEEAVTPDASPVDEPAGWANAPEQTIETPVLAADTADTSIADLAAQVSEPEPVAAAEPVVAEAAPAAGSTVPAGWYADPSGRFELRYWDGAAWTEHVSRAGQQFTDPPVA